MKPIDTVKDKIGQKLEHTKEKANTIKQKIGPISILISIPIQLYILNSLFGEKTVSFGLISFFVFVIIMVQLAEKVIKRDWFKAEDNDYLQIIGITAEDLRNYSIVDVNGAAASLSNPKRTRKGLLYSIWDIDFIEKVIILNPMHSDAKYSRDYKGAILEVEKENIRLKSSLNTLRLKRRMDAKVEAVKMMDQIGAIKAVEMVKSQLEREDYKDEKEYKAAIRENLKKDLAEIEKKFKQAEGG